MSQMSQKRIQVILPMLVCLLGIILNVGGAFSVSAKGIPLYADTAGTVLAAFFGGYIPGILTALLTNIINYMYDDVSIYYGFINVLIAVITAYVAKRGKMRPLKAVVFCLVAISVVSGCIGGVITWFVEGQAFNERNLVMAFLMRFEGVDSFWDWYLLNFVINFIDKVISIVVAGLFITLVPKTMWSKFDMTMWLQEPIAKEKLTQMYGEKKLSLSLNKRIVLLLTAFALVVVSVSTWLSISLFREYSMRQHINLAEGLARVAASVIDGDSVDRYLNEGVTDEEYKKTEKVLRYLLDHTPEVKFIYAYKILPDGCHVVFDLDAENVEAAELGEIIPIESGFMDYMPDLLSGNRIDPIVTDDTYGWLLTAYEPVYDSAGSCVCYAAADIEMEELLAYEGQFLAKLLGIFSGFLFLALSVTLWIAKYQLLLPIGAMTYTASNFSYGDEFERKKNVEALSKLDIATGGEIEKLYRAFLRATEESTRYFEENKQKTGKIDTLQRSFIMALAEMAESRNSFLKGSSHRETEYAEIVAKKMKELGYYREKLTDKYISDLSLAVPLHDVGVIAMPDDAFTDSEKMREHTVKGEEMLKKAASAIPEASYLSEAINTAGCHHESWDGSGYPHGLSGEDIPLSARIMSVVERFDDMTTPNSKEPLSVKEALEIIAKDGGTVFDPLISDAFVKAENELTQAIKERTS